MSLPVSWCCPVPPPRIGEWRWRPWHPLAGLMLQPLIGVWAIRGEAATVTRQLQVPCKEAIAAVMEPVEIKKGGEDEVDTDGPPSETTE